MSIPPVSAETAHELVLGLGRRVVGLAVRRLRGEQVLLELVECVRDARRLLRPRLERLLEGSRTRSGPRSPDAGQLVRDRLQLRDDLGLRLIDDFGATLQGSIRCRNLSAHGHLLVLRALRPDASALWAVTPMPGDR